MKRCAWPPAAALMLVTCACGGSTPSAPAQSVTSPQSEAQGWSLNLQLVSITGDSSCLVSLRLAELTGTAFSNVTTTIERSGSSLKISSPLFRDFFGFSTAIMGTVMGSDFTASGAIPGEGAWTCPDGAEVRQRSGTARITGSFSTDGQQLAATDVHTYPLESGGQMNYTWSWVGTRK